MRGRERGGIAALTFDSTDASEARFSISQMDVPTRAVLHDGDRRPEERPAAAGITGVARTTGAAVSPALAGLLFSRPALINVPFFLAGTLKIVYDLLFGVRATRASRGTQLDLLQM